MSWLKAFKWKRSNPFEFIELVNNLGIERRLNFRILYPDPGAIGELPHVTFAGHSLKIQNISTGGVCILDPNEILGPAVGHEVTLIFHWQKDEQDVRSRIVSRVENRRHIQFLNFSERNQSRIRKHIEPSFRGAALRRVDSTNGSRLKMEACEIWVSMLEDSVTLFDHPHLLGSILYRGQDYLCYRHSFPVFGNDRKRMVPIELYESLVLMLANIPNPSTTLTRFLAELCSIAQERFK